MQCVPCLFNTDTVALSDEIRQLTEELARNTHDSWAKQRLTDGGALDSAATTSRKSLLVLLPYEQLPESEKEYDRNAAMLALKAIVALGYRIEKA